MHHDFIFVCLRRLYWRWQFLFMSSFGAVCASLALGAMLVAAAISVVPTACAAAGSEIPLFPVIKGLRWEAEQTLATNGVPLRVIGFESSQEPASVAAELSGRTRLFQRVLSRSDLLVLSGIHEGWHWIASIRSYGQGAQGHVSGMKIQQHFTERGAP